MTRTEQECILVVDDNMIFRDALVQTLRAASYDVITAETGERAFVTLRDRSCRIDWLYSRAALPGLIDGWILADEYHDVHPGRAVIVATAATAGARSSARRDIVLKQPTPRVVSARLRHLIGRARQIRTAARATADDHRRAAGPGSRRNAPVWTVCSGPVATVRASSGTRRAASAPLR
jgi:DNA-binding NtrC family response regulator